MDDTPIDTPLMGHRDSMTSIHGHDDLAHESSRRFHHLDHRMELHPSVYTSGVYAPAVSRIKQGHINTRGTRLAVFLISLNMILQVGLLRVLDIYGHRDAELSVGGLVRQRSSDKIQEISKKTLMVFRTPVEKDVIQAADDVVPLCTVGNDGGYSCMAPSIEYMTRWRALDTDGDGVWTMLEAMAFERKMLNKSEIIPDAEALNQLSDKWISRKPTLVFNSIVSGLKHRSLQMNEEFNRTLYLSQEVLGRHGIPKAYFDYWMGDAMMCSRFNRYSCEKIAASGLFDAALTKGRLAARYKGIYDYDTAKSYCQAMLQQGGGCEQTLPPSFLQNSVHRQSICGDASMLGESIVPNPYRASEVIAVPKLSFHSIGIQTNAIHPLFIFFKVLIMFLFFSSLVDETLDLIKHGEFLIMFPGLHGPDDRGGKVLAEEERGPEDKRIRITGLHHSHRLGLAMMYFCRVMILVILTRFGCWFLLSESRYIELVMNVLALAFITGIDEALYDTFQDSKGWKDKSVEEMKIRSMIPGTATWFGYLFSRECWGFILIPAVSMLVVFWNVYNVRVPLLDALTCTCLQEGEHCAESMVNQEAWWKNYWSHTLPSAMHQIEALRLTGA